MMPSPPLPALVALLICLISCSGQHQDPVQDFCRRFGHQTTVIDDKLYTDGGLLNWNPMSTYPLNTSNTWLLYQDLAHAGPSGMPPLFANLSKNASVPAVSGGILWGDTVNKLAYLFGGEYAGATTPPAAFALYAYDVLGDLWTSLGPSPGVISPVAYGAGVAVSDTGTGFCYGGWLSNATVSGWTGPPVATTGLVKYSMDGNSWTNNSGPDALGRAEGTMNYIPASDGGMLVYFGGVVQDGNGTVLGQEMDEILLYDILSGRWYTQKTSGTTPQKRRRFCSGVTWPDDQSTYNIYLYGGASMPSDGTPGFDDVYILTIPSFQWIKLYPTDGNNTGQYPHHSLTCNVVNKAQMLIIGGTFPLTHDCDAAPQWGTHNLVLGQQADPAANPWQLFAPSLTTYAVPAAVRAAATSTRPAGGFDNPDLDVLMAKKAVVMTRTPTRAVPGATVTGASHAAAGRRRLGAGAIAGIAVGGAVALAAALVGLCLLVRRWRQRRPPGRAAQPGGPRPAKLNAGESSGYSNGPGSPWRSPHSNFSSAAAGGPRSPSSHGAPSSPFARRPSNLNVQQGPIELPVSADHGEYETEMERVSDGGVAMAPSPLRLAARGSGSHGSEGGPVLDQPDLDDHGRPWYPQASVLHSAVVSTAFHTSPGAHPHSPQKPRGTPQELSTGRRESASGWKEGEVGSPTAASTLMGAPSSGEDSRHTTFYHL